jgi:ribose transport system permease protein
MFFKSITRSTSFGLILAAVSLFAILSIFSDNFLSAYNMYTIGRTLSLYAFIGLAQAVVIIIGDMNLSVGAIGGLATNTAGYLMDIKGYQGWVAILVAVAVGIIAGALNGFISAKFGISAFIVTLATMFIYTGINFGFTQGFSFVNIPKTFTFIGKGKFLGIPLLFLFMIFVLIIVFLFFKYTVTGRRLLAMGENVIAARFSGINDSNLKILAHAMSGLIAAIGAILYISRMGAAQPVVGQDWLIISFAVAIIGGTALSGGGITALGIFVGATIMVMIKNGLILLKTNVYWEQAFLGMLILAAIGIDRIRTIYNQRRLLE